MVAANESSVGPLCGVKRTSTDYVFDFRSSDPELPSVAWTGCDAASSSRVRAKAAVEGKDAHRTLVAAGLGSCARGRPPCETIVGSF